MLVPTWLLAVLLAALVLLLLLLWSARRQRRGRVEVTHLGSLQELVPTLSGLTRGWFVPGNRVTLLQNGDGFFPALLDDVAAARETVHLETYAWWRGEICRRLSEALAARARDGVEVRLLLDAFGSRPADGEDLDRMRSAGVRVVRFRPFELRALGRLNQRTHRKLAIFDGRVGYVFGHGFAAEWEGAGDGRRSWRDTAARLEGPAVGRLQAVFARNWVEETGEVLAGHRHFPELEAAGTVPCQVIPSLPSGGVSPANVLHKLAVAAANRELLIQNPYFCPDGDLVELMEDAADRGVRVRVMVPGPVTDSPMVQHAGHRWFRRLLTAGVEIHEFQPALNHQKVLVVDGAWCCLGSMNFDERSFDINAEVALGMLDEGMATALRDAFEADLERCHRLTLDEWRRRSAWHRLADGAAFLVHEQL